MICEGLTPLRLAVAAAVLLLATPAHAATESPHDGVALTTSFVALVLPMATLHAELPVAETGSVVFGGGWGRRTGVALRPLRIVEVNVQGRWYPLGDTRGGPFLGGAVRQRWTWGHQPAVVGHLDGSSSGQRVHALAGLKRTFSGGTVVGLVAGAGFDHASVQVAQFDRVDGWSRWGGSLHMDVVVGYAP